MNRDIRRFKQYVSDTLGIELPVKSAETIRELLAFRLKELSYDSVDEYVEKLIQRRESKREYQMLVNIVTNNKTSFFRHEDQLHSLEKIIVNLARNEKQRRINIWTAGCSSGEEAYTLAIILKRNRIPGQVLGTDVDEASVSRARCGVYDKWRVEGLEDRLKNWIVDKDENSIEVSHRLKRSVRFEILNLMTSTYPKPDEGQWDFILCRNVLIYFSPRAFQLVTRRFSEVISEAGYFVLSPAEAIPGESTQFLLQQEHGNYFYKQSTIPPDPYASDPEEPKHVLPLPSIIRNALASWKGSPKRVLPGPENGTVPKYETNRRFSDPRVVTQAVQIYESGNREYGVHLLQEYLKRFPDDVCTTVTLGNALIGLKDLRGAEEQFSRALDLDPLMAEIHFFLGMLHRKSGNWEQSARSLKNALFLNGSMWLASFYLAGIWRKLSLPGKAQKAYRVTLTALNDDDRKEFTFVSQLHFLKDAARYRKDIAAVCRKKLGESGNEFRLGA